MHIHRHDLSDILSELSEINAFDTAQDYDVIICTLGFEERTGYIIQKLFDSGNLRGKDLILVTYPTNAESNELNFDKFDNKVDILNSIKIIAYDKISYYTDLKKLLKDKIKEGKNSILFDISTCSSYILYPTLKACFDLPLNLRVAYSEALFYYPTYDQWHVVEEKAKNEIKMFSQTFEDAKFLIDGVDDIYSSNLFSEMNSGNNPSILIAIPNFTKIRMNSIIEKDKDLNKTNADQIVWMLGEPPALENKWRLHALERIYNISTVESNKKITVSTLYYKEMIEKLEELWINYNFTYHITIGNLGSKMQHIGAFVFWMLHPDVGFLLAEPSNFKSKYYSNGVGSTHEINFGSTSALQATFRKYLKFKLDANFPRKS